MRTKSADKKQATEEELIATTKHKIDGKPPTTSAITTNVIKSNYNR